MKSFKEYLVESKQTYEFTIKLAGKYDECCDKIKEALAMYDCAAVSEAKTTPIQETQTDFPTHKNIETTLVDVTLNYPTNSPAVRAAVAEALSISQDDVKVRNPKELEEEEINHQNDEKTGEPLLGHDYEKSNNQSTVGDKHTVSFLKELGKVKTRGEQYKGVNDKILAKKAPAEKASPKSEKGGTVSPVGSKQVILPSAKGQ